MAILDHFFNSVRKIPIVNVTDRTIPPYGAMTLWTMNAEGYFQALPGAAKHLDEAFLPSGWTADNPDTAKSNVHDPDRIRSGAHAGVSGATPTSHTKGETETPTDPFVNAPYAEYGKVGGNYDSGGRGVSSSGWITFTDDRAASGADQTISTEFATAFNFGVAIEPRRKGFCYQSLPAIGRLKDPDLRPAWGDLLTVMLNDFSLVPTEQVHNAYNQKTDYTILDANGWPFMSKIPGQHELVVIGGLNSFFDYKSSDHQYL